MVDLRHRRRWYDKLPDVSHFIETMMMFPPEVQTILCEGIIEVAEEEFEAHELERSIRSLGEEKLLRLWKAQNKSRAYDQHPLLHKAMNYLGIMSDENRRLLTRKANEVMEFTIDYFEICAVFNTEPTVDEVTRVTRTCIQQGRQKARRYLEQVREIVFKKARKKARRALLDREMTIDEQLRIRPDSLSD